MRNLDDKAISSFWGRVDKEGPLWDGSHCWVWNGRKTEKGYGVLTLDGKPVRAHRVSIFLSGRELPSGLVTDHLCRNTSCVNPRHLDLVTNRENVIRGYAARPPKLFCKHGHPKLPKTPCKGCQLANAKKTQSKPNRTVKGVPFKEYCKTYTREYRKRKLGYRVWIQGLPNGFLDVSAENRGQAESKAIKKWKRDFAFPDVLNIEKL